jgi:hypothetical protein
MYEPRIVSWRTGKASGSSLREIMVDVVDFNRCCRCGVMQLLVCSQSKWRQQKQQQQEREHSTNAFRHQDMRWRGS